MKYSRAGVAAGLIMLVIILVVLYKHPAANQPANDDPRKPQKTLVHANELSGVQDPLMRQHLAAQINTPDQRLTTTFGNDNFSTILELAILSKNKINSRSLTKVNGHIRTQLLGIGHTYYAKRAGDTTWHRQVVTNPDKIQEAQAALAAQYVEDILHHQAKEPYKNLGKAPCGARQCYKYQVGADQAAAPANYIWFDTQHLLLRRTQTGPDTSPTMTTAYSYSNIKPIRAPASSVALPADKNIFDYINNAE